MEIGIERRGQRVSGIAIWAEVALRVDCTGLRIYERIEMGIRLHTGAFLRQVGHGRHADGCCWEPLDRKSVVSGKSVSIRVDLGCLRIIKKKNKPKNTKQQVQFKYKIR